MRYMAGIKKRICSEHNEGVSLVELLVALAVGAIVLSALTLLIAQSVKGYNTQTTTSQLQNDANIALNQMEDSIMEASCLKLYGEGTTQAEGTDTQYFYTKDNMVYIYDKGEGRIYLSSSIAEKGSVLCEYVTDFRVRVLESSIGFNGDMADDPNRTVSSINKTVRVTVSITLSNKGITREASKTVNLRNTIEEITLKLGTEEAKIKKGNKTYTQILPYLVKS